MGSDSDSYLLCRSCHGHETYIWYGTQSRSRQSRLNRGLRARTFILVDKRCSLHNLYTKRAAFPRPYNDGETMNGNQASTASVQLSGGSVVDGPSASIITSPSSNGGARTTASEDDSVSQSNGETQLSEQMQQLSIRQDTTIQSNQPSLPELRAYCQSESLTEHGLRERLSRLELQVEDSTYGILLIDSSTNGS